MADTLTTYTGRGPDGDFSIDLPNWAREVTQVKIDKKLGDLNKNFKNLPDNIEKAFDSALKKNVKALNKLVDESKKSSNKQNKKAAEDKKHQNKTQETQAALLNSSLNNAQALKDLEKITNKQGQGGSLQNLLTKASPIGRVINMITKGMGALVGVIKGVATALLTLGAFIGNQLMKTFNMLNKSLSDGTGMLMGAFTDSTVNVAAEAARAGMSLSDFTDALAENSEEIRILGTQGFRELRNAVRDARGGMFDLGYSQEEITQLLGREISIRQRLGMRLDIVGNQLEDDVVITASELRRVANAAGVNAEILYQSAKLTDETNTLISARARQFGDEGISDMFTSIRQLSLRISGLAPTFGSAVTSPLVNAMVTGAVGLDEEFTQLVTVFPGLVDAFQKGNADIMNSGALTESTIDNIMESLVETSEEDFERAKMLALMTRNQTAIQAVNFANEVRAREKLIDEINDESLANRIRSAATVSQQIDIFFDIMKAPFETGITNFMLSVLGVNTSGTDINLASVIDQFVILASKFMRDLPVFGKFFDGSFFTDLSNAVNAYFDPNATSVDRERARSRINQLVTQTISDIGDSFNKVLTSGNLGATISGFFRDLIDELAISIYESTGMMGGTAFMAYLRKEDYGRASEMDPGFAQRMFLGAEDSGNLGVGAMIDARKDIAARFGVKYDDIVEASDLYRENELFDFDASGRVTAVKGLSKNSSLRNLHPDSILLAVQELQLFEAELNKGIKDVMGNDNELTSKELKKGLENNDPKLLKFLSELADPNSELNQMLNRDYKDFYARPGQFKITDAGAQYLDANKYATMMKSESYIQGLVDSFYIDMEQGVEGKARKKSIIAQIARRFQMGGNEMAFNQIIKDAQFSDEELAAYGLKRVNVLDKDNNIVGTRIEMDPNNMGSEIERLVQEIQLSEKETILLKQEVHKLISTLNPNNYVVQ